MNCFPTISVVIPTYNRSFELKRALISVINQVHKPSEIWVIDDGSEENIKAVIDELENDNIFYYKLRSRSNANVARNKGAELSNSDYIAFLDSDDEWLSNHLLAFVNSYNPEVFTLNRF